MNTVDDSIAIIPLLCPFCLIGLTVSYTLRLIAAAIAHCLTKSWCPIVERRPYLNVRMSWKGKVTEEGSLDSTGGRLELEFARFSAILVTNYANSTSSISFQRRDLKFGALDSE